MNNTARLIALAVLFAVLLTACGASKDIEVAVALTQTAAARETPAEDPAENGETGFITGKAICSVAPPNPPMVIYAVDTATGAWFSFEAQQSQTEVPFSLEVPPGSYQVYAFALDASNSYGGYGGYTGNSGELLPVTVAAGQITSGINISPPSQSECGAVYGLPASPDGRFPAIDGPSLECLARLTTQITIEAADAPPDETGLMRIEFMTGEISARSPGTLTPNGIAHYVLTAMAGQQMSLYAQPDGAVTLAVWGADGAILNKDQAGQSAWVGELPRTQDYYIDVISIAPQTVEYSLDVIIPPLSSSSSISSTGDPDAPGAITGSIGYPAQYIPPFHIVAFDLQEGYWYWIGFPENQYTYTIVDLPPGPYHVVAYTDGGKVGGYAGVGDGELIPVTVKAGQTTPNIHMNVWLEPGNPYFPPDPK